MIFLNEEWHILMYENTLKTNNFATIYFFVLTLILIINLYMIFAAFFVNTFLNSPAIKILIKQESFVSKFFNFITTLLKFKRIRNRLGSKKIIIDHPKRQRKAIHDEAEIEESIQGLQGKQIYEEANDNNEELGNDFSNLKKKKTIFKRLIEHYKNFMDYYVKIIDSKIFQNTFSISIFMNVVIYSLDDPFIDPNSSYHKILFSIQLVPFGLYVAYIVANIMISRETKEGFFGNWQNWFDTLIFIVSISGILIFEFSKYKFYFIRQTRSLIFAKLLTFFDSLKMSLKTLAVSIPYILQVLVFFWIPFSFLAVLGVYLLSEKLYTCDRVTENILKNLITNTDCMDWGGNWISQDVTFNNYIEAMSSIFKLVTTEGWSYIMFNAWNSVGVNKLPKKNSSSVITLYFLIMFILGNMIMLTVIIAILIAKYMEEKKFHDPLSKLSPEQKEWIMIKSSIYDTIPKVKLTEPESNKFLLLCYFIAKNKKCKRFFFLVTLANTIVLMLYWSRQDRNMVKILEFLNTILLFIFLLEDLIKIIAYGVKNFFSDKANIIDTLIICVSIFTLMMANYLDSEFKRISYPVQILRIAISFKKLRILRKMIYTLSCILPPAGSIVLMLFIVLLIFLFIGVDLFAYTKVQSIVGGDILHFRSLYGCFQALIRTTTGESWYAIVADISRIQGPNFTCTNISTYGEYKRLGLLGCGRPIIGHLFIFSFHSLVSLLILNLFIAMLLSASEELSKIEESAITRYQLAEILNLWKKYDSKAFGFISFKEFWKFSSEIAIIFQVPSEDLRDINKKVGFFSALSIPVYEDISSKVFCYKFYDAIIALAKLSILLKFDIEDIEPPFNLEREYLKNKKERANKWKKSRFKSTPYKSGDLAKLFVIMRSIRRWKKIAQLRRNSYKSMRHADSLPYSTENYLMADIYDVKKQVLRQRATLKDQEFITKKNKIKK